MDSGKNIRKHVRFKPDYDKFCYIDVDGNDGEFKPTVSAFIVNESKGGCSLLVHDTIALKIDDKCRLKLGDLHPLKAVVRRHKVLDNEVVSLGVEFLE